MHGGSIRRVVVHAPCKRTTEPRNAMVELRGTISSRSTPVTATPVGLYRIHEDSQQLNGGDLGNLQPVHGLPHISLARQNDNNVQQSMREHK